MRKLCLGLAAFSVFAKSAESVLDGDQAVVAASNRMPVSCTVNTTPVSQRLLRSQGSVVGMIPSVAHRSLKSNDSVAGWADRADRGKEERMEFSPSWLELMRKLPPEQAIVEGQPFYKMMYDKFAEDHPEVRENVGDTLTLEILSDLLKFYEQAISKPKSVENDLAEQSSRRYKTILRLQKTLGRRKRTATPTSPHAEEPAITSRDNENAAIESKKKKQSAIESGVEVGPASTSREKEFATESDKEVGPAGTSLVKEESATTSHEIKSDKKSNGKKQKKKKKKKMAKTRSSDTSEPETAPRIEEEPASTSLKKKESAIETGKKAGPASTSRVKEESAIESDRAVGPTSAPWEKKESTVESDKEAGPASTSRGKKDVPIESGVVALPTSTSRVKEESDVIKKPAITSRGKKDVPIESGVVAVPTSTSRVKDRSDVIKKPASTSGEMKDVPIESSVDAGPPPPNSRKVANQIAYLEELISKMVEGWPKEFFEYRLYYLKHDRDMAYGALKSRNPSDKIAEQLALLRDVDAPWVKKEIAWIYNRLAKECASDPDVLAFKWKAMQLHPEEVAEMLAIKHTKSLSSVEHSADQWLYYTTLLEGEKSELALPIEEVWPLLFGKMESQEIKHFFRNVKDPDLLRLVIQMILNQESLHKSK